VTLLPVFTFFKTILDFFLLFFFVCFLSTQTLEELLSLLLLIFVLQHASPLNQPAQMQQRPAWVDDLFRKMDKVESKLNKLDKIDTLVTSLNSKVTKLEVTTQSSDGG
jgi:hypothetical protein